MPRRPRIYIPGMSQHIIHRGNNGCDIFHRDTDRRHFLVLLRDAVERFGVNVHAYVLMTNHVHLLMTPSTEESIAGAVHRTCGLYVQRFNKSYDRTGPLYNGRYRSPPLDTETYWLTCARYIELNPVRAGLASTPDAYRWSSYAAHAYGVPDPLISPHPLYDGLGADAEERQMAWRTLCQSPLTDDELAVMRRNLRQAQTTSAPIDAMST